MTLTKTLSAALLCGSFAIATSALAAGVSTSTAPGSAVRSSASFNPTHKARVHMTGSKMGRPNARQFAEEQRITRQLNQEQLEKNGIQ